MRCPNCNKFVSYDGSEEPEESGEFEVAHTGDRSVTVTGSADRLLNCADCGTELKRGNLEFDIDVVIEHEEGCLGPQMEEVTCSECNGHGDVENEDGANGPCPECDGEGTVEEEKEDEGDPTYEVDVSLEPSENTITDYYDKRTKTRKPCKSSRYWTQEYGVEVTGTVTCERCKATAEFSDNQLMSASSFDESV